MKRVLVVVLSFIMVLSLVGCGTKTSSGDATFAEFDTEKQITLTIGNPGGDSITPPELFDAFREKYPNITLEVDSTPWGDYETKLNKQLAAGNAADVFMMDSGSIATYGGKGLLMDLSAKIDADFNADDYVALDAGKTPDGKVWGVPHAINSVAMFYNKGLFDRFNLPYPEADWTWEEMLEMAKTMSVDEDGDGINDIYGLMTTQNITQGWLPMVLAAGGTPLNEDKTKSNFDDPKTVEGLRLYQEMMDEKITPSPEVKASYGGSMYVPFVNGKVAMIVGQASGIKSVADLAYEGFEYDVQYMPVGYDGKQHTIYVPNLWAINKKASADAAAAAWEWIKFYESEEAQQIIAETTLAGFPIKKSALEKVAQLKPIPENLNVFYDKINENGVTLYENECWMEWSNVVSDNVGKIFRNSEPFDKVIETIQAEVAAILNETFEE